MKLEYSKKWLTYGFSHDSLIWFHFGLPYEIVRFLSQKFSLYLFLYPQYIIKHIWCYDRCSIITICCRVALKTKLSTIKINWMAYFALLGILPEILLGNFSHSQQVWKNCNENPQSLTKISVLNILLFLLYHITYPFLYPSINPSFSWISNYVLAIITHHSKYVMPISLTRAQDLIILFPPRKNCTQWKAPVLSAHMLSFDRCIHFCHPNLFQDIVITITPENTNASFCSVPVPTPRSNQLFYDICIILFCLF